MTYIMLPFVILLHATFKTIDPAILQAASLCGARRWQAFRRVLVPLALPGVAAGGLMVFVMSLGYFVTPALLGGTSNMMLAELIAQLVNRSSTGASAARRRSSCSSYHGDLSPCSSAPRRRACRPGGR